MSKPLENSEPNGRGGQAMAFRKRRNVPRQTRDQSRRQSDLVQSAWRHFREAAPMIAFLNTHHEALEAHPLSLALESDEGLERVEQLLQQLARNA